MFLLRTASNSPRAISASFNGVTLDNNSTVLLKDQTDKNQNGICAICSGKQVQSKNRSLAVDHCHKTNKVRGLLCIECNVGIGKFQDNLQLLISAIKYLKANH